MAPQDPKRPRSMTRDEFVKNARSAMQRAEKEGPIVVTDENGKPRMAIHCRRQKLPYSVD